MALNGDVVRPREWWKALPRPIYGQLKRVESPQPWFEVYGIEPDIYAFYEPGQFEEALSYLVIGEEKAALIDTGTGIDNIRTLAEHYTELPVMVVNTHHHLDHVAGNYLFDEVAIYDHPTARRTAERGYSHREAVELLAEGLVWKPLPEGFNPNTYHVPPFRVTRWLHDGDVIDLGGRRLEVIHTPGHSPDSICLLDRGSRLLWTGDLFYTGAIYTHLPGGDIDQLIESYRRLIDLGHLYDRLMPGHNEPWIEGEMLREVLEALEEIREGEESYIEGEDGLRRYDYGRFSIIWRLED
ncbi:MBL fold metallo-hydrolase [Candidatus Bathyarchaeota archaeon]|nr:MAG: MBL fold metallo-hydrolase [Candidatus Bathyarchaeota archaeon]